MGERLRGAPKRRQSHCSPACKSGKKRPASLVRPKLGVSMKAILCSQYCGPDDLVLADVPIPSPDRRGRDRDQDGGAEFLRSLDDPGETRSSRRSVFAGGRGRGRDRKRRRRRHRPQGRRSRGGVLRPQWRARKDRAAGQFDRQDSRQSRFRSRRRDLHHLRHSAACAGRSRQPEAGRDHGGARALPAAPALRPASSAS